MQAKYDDITRGHQPSVTLMPHRRRHRHQQQHQQQ